MSHDEEHAATLVTLEGLIGCGKSTLMRHVAAYHASLPAPSFNLLTVEECLADYTSYSPRLWEDNTDLVDTPAYNPLALAYADPVRCLPVAQMHFSQVIRRELLAARTRMLLEAKHITDKPWVLLTDRGLLSPEIFTQAAYVSGSVADFARDYLCSEARSSAKETLERANLAPGYRGVYFLRVDKSTCLERIRLRGRPYEQQLRLADLAVLEHTYDRYLEKYQSGGYPCLAGDCRTHVTKDTSAASLHRYLEMLVSSQPRDEHESEQLSAL